MSFVAIMLNLLCIALMFYTILADFRHTRNYGELRPKRKEWLGRKKLNIPGQKDSFLDILRKAC